MIEAGALTWREVVDKYHSALVDELTVRLDSDIREAVNRAVAAEQAIASARLKSACDEVRRTQVESLNQILRRLRTSPEDKVLELLAEGCASFTPQLVVLVFENDQARSVSGVGLAGGDAETDEQKAEIGPIEFPTNSAPAIVSAIDSRDPVVALGVAAEISAELAGAFSRTVGPAGDPKAYLFPVVARHSVMAMLVASGVELSAPIE
ncbi:MAG TPA: hypothetical protein VHC72_20915, partial [Bryobacteraceae bacterium]|nr:hypothetical protein [Bryobacteraceae bacterium]